MGMKHAIERDEPRVLSKSMSRCIWMTCRHSILSHNAAEVNLSQRLAMR